MRIAHISDTHGCHRNLKDLPKANIIIHTGDISLSGESSEVVDFIEWFSDLDYRYKIFIAGNHDFILDGKDREQIQQFLPHNCFYLCNSGITIEGINFWGVPFFFSEDVSGTYLDMIEQIPDNTDILITHRPPFKILDRADNINYGCPEILKSVQRIKPQYHLFGHIHDAYGVKQSKHTTFINAAVVNEGYQVANKPIEFEV